MKRDIFDNSQFKFRTEPYVKKARKAYSENCYKHLLERSRIVRTGKKDLLTISIGRLHAMHSAAREELLGKFTKWELLDLISLFECEILNERQIMDLEYEIKRETQSSNESIVVQKIRKLSVLEKFTLVDLIEQAWQYGRNGNGLDEMLMDIGFNEHVASDFCWGNSQ